MLKAKEKKKVMEKEKSSFDEMVKNIVENKYHLDDKQMYEYVKE